MKFVTLLAAGALMPIQACLPQEPKPSPHSTLINDWLNSLAAKDWNRWLGLHAPNFTWYPQGGGEPVQGQEQLAEKIQVSAAATEGTEVIPIRTFFQGDWICAQYILRHSGTLTPSVCGVFQVREGFVTE